MYVCLHINMIKKRSLLLFIKEYRVHYNDSTGSTTTAVSPILGTNFFEFEFFMYVPKTTLKFLKSVWVIYRRGLGHLPGARVPVYNTNGHIDEHPSNTRRYGTFYKKTFFGCVYPFFLLFFPGLAFIFTFFYTSYFPYIRFSLFYESLPPSLPGVFITGGHS